MPFRDVAPPEEFVKTSLIRLICRITRIAWCEDAQQRQIVDRCKELLASPEPKRQYLGCRILNDLVAEMGVSNKVPTSPLQGYR